MDMSAVAESRLSEDSLTDDHANGSEANREKLSNGVLGSHEGEHQFQKAISAWRSGFSSSFENEAYDS